MTDSTETPKTLQRCRVVICRGQYCNESRRADQLLKVLQPRLDELNASQYPPRIKLEIANCLSMCGAGPNLIIYQGTAETIYHHLKPTDIEQIVNTHLS